VLTLYLQHSLKNEKDNQRDNREVNYNAYGNAQCEFNLVGFVTEMPHTRERTYAAH